ncbi:HAD family hydrolase [Nitratifractor sp.]|uniref:HAD-IIIC family phosphatase n=1 Tax=Nitratifractor sp. TaxID=2268144 RepID=UPI0025F57FFD|nr:HAD-IIIC family phosphatase [Nitratifractor sp.]
MKKIHFLSNMIVQPVGRQLRKKYRCSYADLDAVVPTLSGTVEADYLVILLDPRFFYDGDIDGKAMERVAMLEGLLQTFRGKNRARILLGNVDDDFFAPDTAGRTRSFAKLLELNEALEALKGSISDLEILDLFALAHRMGHRRLYNEKNRHLFQSPLTLEGAQAVAELIDEAIRRFESKRKKVIVLDGDNTLWGGIVGEDGVEGVACDENYPGIAYKRFQQLLLTLKESGLLLAMVSKNNEADVAELFEKRRMPLKLEDFVVAKINWQPKSQNIAEIAGELNLGLESFLFVDDNPFELEEVARALPAVETFRFDKEEPLKNLEALASRPNLQAIRVTEEDRRKSEQYASERARGEILKTAPDMESFIKSLHIKITWWRNNLRQLDRITQLINKTNQFNLTTRRYTQAEVEAMMRKDHVFSFKVEDDLGDMGIVGVVIVKGGHIDTFLLSCRVLGRGIEDRIMDIVLKEAEVESAEYIPSPKNMQVADLYETLGFELSETSENGTKLYRYRGKEPGRAYITIQKGET